MKNSSALPYANDNPEWTGYSSYGESQRTTEYSPVLPSVQNSHQEGAIARRATPKEPEDNRNGYLDGFTEVFETDIEFCSRSEAICAELLRRFIPHFRLQPGVTFQVAIGRDAHGNTLAVDFLVDGVLFEYHPVRFFKNKRRCGDFNSKREYRAYTDICHSLGAEQREFFQHAMRARLADNYYHKRRALLDQHPVYRRMELVVATSPEEFYILILRRFGRNVPPTVERFLDVFEELRESLPS